MDMTRTATDFLPVSPELVPATLFARRKYWAQRFGMAPVLPTTRAEMDELGWDSCDVILVTGDAYIDHPSFGMALVGRLLESHGFRVGILDQPDWRSADAFRALGRPNRHVGRDRREHGLDGQPLHVRSEGSPRRRVLARRRRRACARIAR